MDNTKWTCLPEFKIVLINTIQHWEYNTYIVKSLITCPIKNHEYYEYKVIASGTDEYLVETGTLLKTPNNKFFLQGQSITYNKLGSVWKITEYFMDRHHGSYLEFHNNTKIAKNYNYKYGVLNEYCAQYDENGKKIKGMIYSDGKLCAVSENNNYSDSKNQIITRHAFSKILDDVKKKSRKEYMPLNTEEITAKDMRFVDWKN
jgi:antitoxin component YwqK of YwqJK toxin-antitoxin module